MRRSGSTYGVDGCQNLWAQEGYTNIALASFKIAVRGACSPLTWLQLVRVHPQAHGTTCKAPIGPEFFEDLIQTFFFGLYTYLHRTGYYHHADIIGFFASL